MDDDLPWADSAIRTDYEAALGRFILAFNEVDYRLSQLIGSELAHRGRADLAGTATKGPFAQRLETLDLLVSGASNKELAALPLAPLRALNGARNMLVHGHFDQNPFDGSYNILLAKARDYPVARVLALATELTAIAESFRQTEAFYAFSDITVENPRPPRVDNSSFYGDAET